MLIEYRLKKNPRSNCRQVCLFVWVEALRPSQHFFSHVGTGPPLPGYYQYFLGGKCILLKDTTWRPPNPRPLAPESDALPLGHRASLQTNDKNNQRIIPNPHVYFQKVSKFQSFKGISIKLPEDCAHKVPTCTTCIYSL